MGKGVNPSTEQRMENTGGKRLRKDCEWESQEPLRFLLRGCVGFGNLVDDAANENRMDVDAAGEVGQEFGNHILFRGQSQRDAVTG